MMANRSARELTSSELVQADGLACVFEHSTIRSQLVLPVDSAKFSTSFMDRIVWMRMPSHGPCRPHMAGSA